MLNGNIQLLFRSEKLSTEVEFLKICNRYNGWRAFFALSNNLFSILSDVSM